MLNGHFARVSTQLLRDELQRAAQPGRRTGASCISRYFESVPGLYCRLVLYKPGTDSKYLDTLNP